MNRNHRLSVVSATLALFAGLAPISVAQGLDLNDLERAAEPCTDFDAFANGAWRAANPIPAGTQRWSRRLAARDANREQLNALLEELAAKPDRPRGSVEQQLGDHYAACLDEPGIDAAGATPLAPLLAEIAAIQDAKGVQRLIRRLHELAIPAPFAASSAFDYHDPALLVLNIAPGGLGMPDGARVARVLTLAGMAEAPARKAADDIHALEMRLAEASLAPEKAADPAATAHKLSFAQLSRLAPRVDWESYFTEAGLPRSDVNVAEPALLERVSRELEATPVTVWKAYLTWHLLEPFAEESAAATPRATRCLESTEALLGEPLGRVYAERRFSPAAKARVQEMSRTLLAVLKDDLRDLKWMSDATQQQALAKVEAYEVKVGYPDTWTDTSALIIRRDAFWANVAAARRFGVEADRKRVGQRISRTLWGLPPSSPGAYIDVQLNVMGLPAGFLQPWAFDPAASDAVNYGAIGAGIAHDLTHAIDALGADFDATGQPRNWWTAPDRDAFQKLGQCTVDQYGAYTIEPGASLQGKQVLGEALGDLAGVRVAYRALHRSMQRRPVPVIDGLGPDQQFFIAYGQFRGGSESLEFQRQMLKGDSHAPSRYRVIGPLSNLAEFQQAFACKAGSPMVRPPERRCAAW